MSSVPANPKPFGKPIGADRPLTRGLRLAIAVWVAGIPAFFICSFGSSRYPTLAESPFFWPSVLAFIAFYVIAIVNWLRHRPRPHGPWERGCVPLGLGRLFLALAFATPAGFASAYLYEPAVEVANGSFAMGSSTKVHAMVSETAPQTVVNFLYASPPFHWKVPSEKFSAPDVKPGSLATLTVRTGLFGALWVENIEYEILR